MLWPKMRSCFQLNHCVFKHEKLEDCHWNHYDDYICDLAGSALISSTLKFWRTRLILIPDPSKALHHLKSKWNDDVTTAKPRRFDHFDVEESFEDNLNELENLVRFLDLLNRIRRSHKTALCNRWKSTASLHNLQNNKSFTSSSSYTIHGPSPHPPDSTPTPPAPTTPPSERTTPIRMMQNPSTDLPAEIAHPIAIHRKLQSDDVIVKKSLSVDSSFDDVIAAMRDEKTGIKFLPDDHKLPHNSFLTIEAVHWAMNRIGDLRDFQQACQLFDSLHKWNYITHRSGNINRNFAYGYVIFYITEKSLNHEIDDLSSLQLNDRKRPAVDNRWFEIEFERDVIPFSISFDDSTKWRNVLGKQKSSLPALSFLRPGKRSRITAEVSITKNS